MATTLSSVRFSYNPETLQVSCFSEGPGTITAEEALAISIIKLVESLDFVGKGLGEIEQRMT